MFGFRAVSMLKLQFQLSNNCLIVQTPYVRCISKQKV
ncbi:hypothetical protein L365_01319 [Klebsiella pneumoniae MGH 19]|nr:hypothetical protein L365_01319 [Klebsiella pneumoniae MGH 19]SYR78125.1 Uncharacterised protein [Klebsiella pneumoniae]VGF90225.1 Uncharacterised protein [Klebsiella pneumoniae]